MRNLSLFLVLLVFGFSSCEKNCDESNLAYVTWTDAPETGTVHEEINVDLAFYFSKPSGKFEKFIVSRSNNSLYIDVIAYYQGCDHLAVLTGGSSTFTFIPSEAGTYYLNFTSGNAESVRDTIVVN
jgi:hypothetical protein